MQYFKLPRASSPPGVHFPPSSLGTRSDGMQIPIELPRRSHRRTFAAGSASAFSRLKKLKGGKDLRVQRAKREGEEGGEDDDGILAKTDN